MASNLRAQILDAASRLFYSQGIKATGVDAVVKEAGTTKMSLYKYFPSKDDLVLAYLREKSEKMKERIFSVLEESYDSPVARLLTVFDVFDQFLADPDFRGCPFINASAEYAIEDNPMQRISREFYEGFRNELNKLTRQAGCKDAENIARQLALLIAGAIVSEQMQRGSGALVQARKAAKVLVAEAISKPGSR
jgi:AcrR family transcriptional regulator